jgi:hypothetical protein
LEDTLIKADDYVTLWGIIVVWASASIYLEQLQLGGEDFWCDCCADRCYYSIKYRYHSYSVAYLRCCLDIYHSARHSAAAFSCEL